MGEQPSFQAIPVQRCLWESLEALLLYESKRLVENVAKTLHQDPKLLWNEIRKDKLTAYLVDCNEPTAERFLCTALRHTTAVACRCRKPVVFGTTFCPEHQGWSLPSFCEKIPQLRRIVVDEEIYYLDELTAYVYNENYERCGHKQGDKLYLFEVEGQT